MRQAWETPKPDISRYSDQRSAVKRAIAALITAGVLVVGATSSYALSFGTGTYDDFAGKPLWFPRHVGTGFSARINLVPVGDGNIQFDVTPNATSNGAANSQFGHWRVSTCSFNGDFDIITDIKGVEFPMYAGVRGVLAIENPADNQRIAHVGYASYLSGDGTLPKGTNITSNIAGKVRSIPPPPHFKRIRLKRTGNTITAMVDAPQSSSWVTVDSYTVPLYTPKVRFLIGVQSTDLVFKKLRVRITFDNVTINTGTCSY